MAEITEKIIIQVNLNNDQVKKELQLSKDATDKFKESLAVAKIQLKGLESQGQASSVAATNLRKNISDLTTSIQAQTKVSNQLQLQLTKTAQANIAETGSLNQKRAAYAAASIAIANAGKVEGELSAETLALIQNSRALKEEILKEAGAFGSTVENVGNYKTAIREATLEAQQLQRQSKAGLVDPERVVEAQKKVATLKEELNDFNASVAALNPEAKFKSIVQATGAIAGGFSAASSAAVLFGSDGEEIAKVLTKIQAAANIATGLNQLAELPDALRNIKLALGIVTVAQQAKTVADVENTAAVTGNTAAQATEVVVVESSTVAKEGATVATEALTVAEYSLLAPLALAAVAIGIVIAAFQLLTDQHFDEQIQSITKNIDSENEAHQVTIEKLKQISDAQVSQAENAVKVAEAEGKSGAEIVALQNNVIEAKRTALKKEVDENAQNFQVLTKQRRDAQALLLQDLGEEETKKAQVAEAEAKKGLDAIKKRNAAIQIEANNLNTELNVIDLNATNKSAAIAAEASQLRISLIKNNREREIEAEKAANSEKLRVLQKDSITNSELIEATQLASAQRIKDINLKFDIETAQDRNKLTILSTVEGSQARFEAEKKGIIALRNLQLQETGLTETQRRVIIAESNEKIFNLEQARIQKQNAIADAQVQAESARTIAILNARKQAATSVSDKNAIDVQIVKANLDAELAEIRAANERKRAEIENEKTFEIEAAKGNSVAIKEITVAKNAELSALNTKAEADQLNLITKATADQLAVVTKGKQDELSREAFLLSQKTGLVLQNSQEELDLRIEQIQNGAEKLKLEYQNDAAARVAIDAAANSQIDAARLAFIQAQVQQVADFTNQLISLSNLAAQNEAINDQNKLTRLQKSNDEEKKKLKKKLDDGVITQAQYDDDVLALDTKLQKKQAEIKTEQFEKQKDADIIQSIINTALAVTKALPNIPLAIAAGVFGLAQTALISSKPTPEFYYGGYTEPGNPREVSRFSNPARTVHKGEWIGSAAMVEHPYYGKVINGLERAQRGMNSNLSSLTGYAMGGFSQDFSGVNQGIVSATIDNFAFANAVTSSLIENFPTIYTVPVENDAVLNRVRAIEFRASS